MIKGFVTRLRCERYESYRQGEERVKVTEKETGQEFPSLSPKLGNEEWVYCYWRGMGIRGMGMEKRRGYQRSLGRKSENASNGRTIETQSIMCAQEKRQRE